MSKLIITRIHLFEKSFLLCAFTENQKIAELRAEPIGNQSILGNVYVGEVEKIVSNIQAAFVRFAENQNGYLPLKETENGIFVSGYKKGQPLKPGNQLLVQVNRDAMKMKLPSLTTDINLPGKYLVLTSKNKSIGFSKKLSAESSHRLKLWMEDEQQNELREYGIVVRTNAGEAEKKDFLFELEYLKRLFSKITVDGRYRTPFSLLFEAEPFYITAVRDVYSSDLTEIITDLPEIHEKIRAYLTEFKPEEIDKLRFYQDKLLGLHKLYSLEAAVNEALKEKIWLKGGGFLVIQQTEAFVSIDVNSGKYTAEKKAEETYRKINLEAAEEAARQIRLRNVSGIILIDFINMKNPDHLDELFHVMQKYLRKDPVKSTVVDITPLQIMEITRKKIRKSLHESLN